MAKYHNPNLADSQIDVSPEEVDKFLGGTQTLQNSGYVPYVLPAAPPTTPGIIPVGGNQQQGGTTPPAGGAEGDFFSKFKEYRDTLYGPQADMASEKARIAAAEQERKAAAERRIRAGFDSNRRAAEKETKERKEGINVGLGMNQGLNWSSTGEDELAQEGERLVGMLGDISSREQEALAREDELGADRLSKALSDLRTERRQADTDAINLFTSITSNELARRQEDRLAKGQDNTEKNQKRDDSRAVLTSILDKFAGADLANLPEEVRTTLKQIESEAGYPPGFVEQGLQSLKELKQAQAQDIALQKLDQNQAKLEQQMLIAQMNAMIRAVGSIGSGITVNIPGLGPVTGTDSGPSSNSSGPSGSVQEESKIIDAKGNQIGFRQRMKDGSIKIVDMYGKTLDPKKVPANASVVDVVGPPKSATGGLNALMESMSL